ncbi:BTB domain-containing protein [Aphelenchoides besseyi]|nr:BTB domain-containing protein [Aphelenchoides besseyi]
MCIERNMGIQSPASLSDYYAKMASNLWSYREKGSYCDLSILGVTVEALKQILNFVYTGHINLSLRNVFDLSRAADYMLVSPVQEICHQFLIENITIDNCLAIKELTNMISAEKLSNMIDEFVLNNFEHLYSHPQIGVYPLEDFHDLIISDRLCVEREFQVVQAIIHWISFDYEGRIQLLGRLITSVRFLFITPSEFEIAISQCKSSDDATALMDEISETLCQMTVKNNRNINQKEHYIKQGFFPSTNLFPSISAQRLSNDHRFLPQSRNSNSGLVVCLGGRRLSTSPSDYIEVYNPSKSEWTHKIELPFVNRQVAIAVVDKKIYLTRNDGRNASSFVFDVTRLQFATLPAMPIQRRCCGLTALNRNLFVVGGSSDSLVRDTAFTNTQCYDIDSQTWKQVASMHIGRRNLVAVSVDNHVYAIGGCSSETSFVNSVERYDKNEDKWELVTSMQNARYSAGAAVLGDRIFVIGGFGENINENETKVPKPLAACEVYDTKTNQWTPIASLSTSRGGCSACVIGGSRIMVVGGYNGTYLNSCEIYDPLTNRWSYCESLQEERAGCGVACVDMRFEEFCQSINTPSTV